jgi:hypothetical protein
MAGQLTGVPTHAPLDWHVSPWVQTLLSLQEVPVLATQAPVVAEHAKHPVQAEPVGTHAPLALQVSGCCPLHVTLDGEQTPVHAPSRQTNGQAEPVFVHSPAELHA